MRVTLQRSRGLLLYLVLIHALAGSLFMLLSLNSLLTLLLNLLLVVSLLFCSRRYGWLKVQAAISQFHCDGENRWFLAGKKIQKGAWQLQHSVILGPLMIVSFRSQAKKRLQPVVIARDAVDIETWRQLCLKLRDPETWD